MNCLFQAKDAKYKVIVKLSCEKVRELIKLNINPNFEINEGVTAEWIIDEEEWDFDGTSFPYLSTGIGIKFKSNYAIIKTSEGGDVGTDIVEDKYHLVWLENHMPDNKWHEHYDAYYHHMYWNFNKRGVTC